MGRLALDADQDRGVDRLQRRGHLAKGFGGRILSAVGNLGRLLYNAGQAVVQGFVNGITSVSTR